MESKKLPKVLFLGNGICRTFYSKESDSSEEYINNQLGDIGIDASDESYKNSSFPFKVSLILNSHKNAKQIAKQFNKGTVSEDLRKFLFDAISNGFTTILTTNFGYEIESCILNKEVSGAQLKQYSKRLDNRRKKKKESKYLIHTCYEFKVLNKTVRVWHIHGEARNPSSIIYGHRSYGNLIARYVKELDRYKTKLKNNTLLSENQSWLFPFIFGEVHIIGFKYDLGEFDLWWLLDRKNNEKHRKGRAHYHRISDVEEYDYMRTQLFEMYSVEEIITKGDYKELYLDFANKTKGALYEE